MADIRRRVRDPGRKQRILASAAALGSRRGFHAISMADIGADAGIVGSGIYRHFDSKTSILVAMLDQVMDRLAAGAAQILAAGAGAAGAGAGAAGAGSGAAGAGSGTGAAGAASGAGAQSGVTAGAGGGTGSGGAGTLSELVRDHITVAIEDHDVLGVYHREVDTLPEEDRRRLRRRQRHYIEEWVHLLTPLRPDLTEGERRLAVHAAIGAIQSTLFFRSGLDPDRLARRLEVMAHGCLGTTPVPFGSELSLTSR
jgi:AcrR family transcriptional regulator